MTPPNVLEGVSRYQKTLHTIDTSGQLAPDVEEALEMMNGNLLKAAGYKSVREVGYY